MLPGNFFSGGRLRKPSKGCEDLFTTDVEVGQSFLRIAGYGVEIPRTHGLHSSLR